MPSCMSEELKNGIILKIILRTFVPAEYKNQAQREVRLTHEGRHNVTSTKLLNTKTLEIMMEKIFNLIETKDTTTLKKGRLTASEMIQKYKDEPYLLKEKTY